MLRSDRRDVRFEVDLQGVVELVETMIRTA
jgi:hypothetical protein